MKFQSLILSLAIASVSLVQAAEVKIMHIQLGGDYHQLFQKEISSNPDAHGEAVEAVVLPVPMRKKNNPFHLTSYNWDFGDVFAPGSAKKVSDVPIAQPSELEWFGQSVESGKAPDVMIISGHHIPGIGWHSNDTWDENDDFYERSLLLSTLLKTREQNPEARRFFDNVKFVFISGCWGLANLEPHKSNGQFYSSDELFTLYASGDQGREKVRGSFQKSYSLEAERLYLARNYPGDFTENDENEICYGLRCVTYNVRKYMSDDGLIDGSHRYNQPYNIRKLFPNAALVFGFHSSSPFEGPVMKLIRATLSRAKQSPLLKEADKDYAQNIVNSIVSLETPGATKMRLIQSFREAWTTVTWEQNKGQMSNYWGGRPGSSITPAYPNLDNDGVFAWPKGYKNPSFAPRCFQYREDAKPCKSQE